MGATLVDLLRKLPLRVQKHTVTARGWSTGGQAWEKFAPLAEVLGRSGPGRGLQILHKHVKS